MTVKMVSSLLSLPMATTQSKKKQKPMAVIGSKSDKFP